MDFENDYCIIYEVKNENMITYYIYEEEVVEYVRKGFEVRVISVKEYSNEFNTATKNSHIFQITKNGKYLIHPLADIFRNRRIYERDNPFYNLKYYGSVPYNPQQHKQIHRDYDRIYKERGIDDYENNDRCDIQ